MNFFKFFLFLFISQIMFSQPTYTGGNTIYNIYDDASFEGLPANPIDGVPSFNGEYETSLDAFHWNTWSECNEAHPPEPFFHFEDHFELVSFPFVPDLENSGSFDRKMVMGDLNETFFEIEQEIPTVPGGNFDLHPGLASHQFYSYLPSYENRYKIPHSIYRHVTDFYCQGVEGNLPNFFEPGFSLEEQHLLTHDFVIDHTRGRMRDYPFIAENFLTEVGPSTGVYDVLVYPVFQLSDSFLEEPSNFVDFYPADEVEYNCPEVYCDYRFYPEDFEEAWDPELYWYPAPNSIPSFHLAGAGGELPVGWKLDASVGEGLQKIEGIQQDYYIDKNIDVSLINPSQQIVYNPSEVHITTDDLVFPSGYTFQTVRGLPPTLDEVAASPCESIDQIDVRDMPISTDLENSSFTFDSGVSVDTKASVYILEAGSKLTIEPCVSIYGATFIVKNGAKLIYSPNLTFGDFDPEIDIVKESEALCKVIETTRTGECNDCKCQQSFTYDDGLIINDEFIINNEEAVIKGNIVVKSGGVLKISNSVIRFADSKKVNIPTGVIVERGGRIEVKDSELNVLECHDMWDGIIVKGKPTASQLALNQGTFLIGNSSIQNARTGVQVGTLFTSTGGGYGSINNTKFLNNHKSIVMMPYKSVNKTRIIGCAFDQTRPLRDEEYRVEAPHKLEDLLKPVGLFETHILAFQVQGVDILNCTFDNTYSPGNGNGINSVWSSIKIGLNDDPITFTPANSVSSFKNLMVGVRTYGAGGIFQNLSIRDSEFVNNKSGILSSGNTFDEIIGNTFTCTAGQVSGVHLVGAQNYIVAGNLFELSDEPSPSSADLDFNSYGIVLNNSGSGGGEVFSNTFDGFTVGTQFEEDNSFLSVKCNSYFQNNSYGEEGFSNCGFDGSFTPFSFEPCSFSWLVNPSTGNSSIIDFLGNQGINCNPGGTAGNLFYGTENADATTGFSDIYIQNWSSSSDLEYFANGDPDTTVPDWTFGQIDVTNCFNSVEDLLGCPIIPINDDDVNNLISTTKPDKIAIIIRYEELGQGEEIRHVNKVVRAYLNSDKKNDCIKFLKSMNTINSIRILVDVYLGLGEEARAKENLDFLRSTGEISSDYYDFYELLINVMADGRTLFELTIPEQKFVNALIFNESSIYTKAESLMAYSKGQEFIKAPYVLESGKTADPILEEPNFDNKPIFYPNPASDALFFDIEFDNTRISIFDLEGKQIHQTNFEKGKQSLKLSLPNGTYIVQEQNEAGIKNTQKLLILN